MKCNDVLKSRDGENYFSRRNVTDAHEKVQTWTIHKLRFKPGFKRTKWVQSTFVAAFQVAEKNLETKKVSS